MVTFISATHDLWRRNDAVHEYELDLFCWIINPRRIWLGPVRQVNLNTTTINMSDMPLKRLPAPRSKTHDVLMALGE